MLKDLCKVFGVKHLDMLRKVRSLCHADLVSTPALFKAM